jgi:hypothetical protein
MLYPKTVKYVLGFVLVGGLALMIGPAVAGDNPSCDPVSGYGETTVGGIPGVFEGSGVIVIRGEAFDVDVQVTGGMPWYGDDGTMHVVTSHTITYVDGDGVPSVMVTVDDAVLEPNPDGAPGEFRLNSNMEISSGSGIFEGVGGRLSGHGTMDMFDEVNNVPFPFYGEASYDLRGVICD